MSYRLLKAFVFLLLAVPVLAQDNTNKFWNVRAATNVMASSITLGGAYDGRGNVTGGVQRSTWPSGGGSTNPPNLAAVLGQGIDANGYGITNLSYLDVRQTNIDGSTLPVASLGGYWGAYPGQGIFSRLVFLKDPVDEAWTLTTLDPGGVQITNIYFYVAGPGASFQAMGDATIYLGGSLLAGNYTNGPFSAKFVIREGSTQEVQSGCIVIFDAGSTNQSDAYSVYGSQSGSHPTNDFRNAHVIVSSDSLGDPLAAMNSNAVAAMLTNKLNNGSVTFNGVPATNGSAFSFPTQLYQVIGNNNDASNQNINNVATLTAQNVYAGQSFYLWDQLNTTYQRVFINPGGYMQYGSRTLWDSANLPASTLFTNGGATVNGQVISNGAAIVVSGGGSATNTFATNSTYAVTAQVASNALALGGVAAASYVTNGSPQFVLVGTSDGMVISTASGAQLTVTTSLPFGLTLPTLTVNGTLTATTVNYSNATITVTGTNTVIAGGGSTYLNIFSNALFQFTIGSSTNSALNATGLWISNGTLEASSAMVSLPNQTNEPTGYTGYFHTQDLSGATVLLSQSLFTNTTASAGVVTIVGPHVQVGTNVPPGATVLTNTPPLQSVINAGSLSGSDLMLTGTIWTAGIIATNASGSVTNSGKVAFSNGVPYLITGSSTNRIITAADTNAFLNSGSFTTSGSQSGLGTITTANGAFTLTMNSGILTNNQIGVTLDGVVIGQAITNVYSGGNSGNGTVGPVVNNTFSITFPAGATVVTNTPGINPVLSSGNYATQTLVMAHMTVATNKSHYVRFETQLDATLQTNAFGASNSVPIWISSDGSTNILPYSTGTYPAMTVGLAMTASSAQALQGFAVSSGNPSASNVLAYVDTGSGLKWQGQRIVDLGGATNGQPISRFNNDSAFENKSVTNNCFNKGQQVITNAVSGGQSGSGSVAVGNNTATITFPASGGAASATNAVTLISVNGTWYSNVTAVVFTNSSTLLSSSANGSTVTVTYANSTSATNVTQLTGGGVLFVTTKLSQSQPANSSTLTQMLFSNTVIDTSSAWSNAANAYACPTNGNYHVCATVSFVTSLSSRGIIYVYTNGLQYVSMAQGIATVGTDFSICGCANVKANKNDLLSVWFLGSAASGSVVSNDTTTSSMSVNFLGQ